MMATSHRERTPTDRNPEQRERPEEGCDLSSVDDLACESKGVADRAKYIADHEAALQDRRAKYDTTRSAYTTARDTAVPNVTGIRRDLRQIREQLRCQLDQETTECLDDAWAEIAERLEQCGSPRTGCCVEECDDDAAIEGYEDDDLHELTARIARIEATVTAAESCFGELVGEPAALAERVAVLRADVDALLTEISDPKTADAKHAYATLRWLWHRYDDIWWGFRRVRDFHDCLCRALTCSVTGRRVLGILVGRLGVLRCHKASEAVRCETLRTHVVAEVLEVCARRCRIDRDEDGPEQERCAGSAAAAHEETQSVSDDAREGGSGGPSGDDKKSDDRETSSGSSW
jgi:hypothetical protein